MTVKQRIKTFVDYKEMSDRQFSLSVGMSPGYVNAISKSVQPDVINKISAQYSELNIQWLLTGEGEMLKSGVGSVATTLISDTSGIPFYDIDVAASFVESFSDVREDVAYYINYPPLKDCTAAFPVYGDSMTPDFLSGEVVLVKQITNINSMLWGEPYLVITNANCDNLRTIKNVHISSDRKSFILRASNPKYAGDTIVECDDVIGIFLIKGKLNRRQL